MCQAQEVRAAPAGLERETSHRLEKEDRPRHRRQRISGPAPPRPRRSALLGPLWRTAIADPRCCVGPVPSRAPPRIDCRARVQTAVRALRRGMRPGHAAPESAAQGWRRWAGSGGDAMVARAGGDDESGGI